MTPSRLKCIGTVLLLGSIGLPLVSEEKGPVPSQDRERIEKRIQEIQPTAKEKRFDEIGWVKGLREAERVSKQTGRPVFLFCNVGQMDIGRC